MKSRKTSLAAGLGLAAVAFVSMSVTGQFTGGDTRVRGERFGHTGRVEYEGFTAASAASEALSGFDNLSNGFDEQGPAFETLNEDNVVALRSFNDNRFLFEEVETLAEGLGPTYNAQSCRECHQNIVTGGASQIAEHRTGRLNVNHVFFESMGGTLIHSRSTHRDILERVADRDNVRTFRISTSTLGAGYVEAVANETLLATRNAQPASLRGTAIRVPVLEGNGSARIGRFGWK